MLNSFQHLTTKIPNQVRNDVCFENFAQIYPLPEKSWLQTVKTFRIRVTIFNLRIFWTSVVIALLLFKLSCYSYPVRVHYVNMYMYVMQTCSCLWCKQNLFVRDAIVYMTEGQSCTWQPHCQNKSCQWVCQNYFLQIHVCCFNRKFYIIYPIYCKFLIVNFILLCYTLFMRTKFKLRTQQLSNSATQQLATTFFLQKYINWLTRRILWKIE